jgi:hypothetical protein
LKKNQRGGHWYIFCSGLDSIKGGKPDYGCLTGGHEKIISVYYNLKKVTRLTGLLLEFNCWSREFKSLTLDHEVRNGGH